MSQSKRSLIKEKRALEIEIEVMTGVVQDMKWEESHRMPFERRLRRAEATVVRLQDELNSVNSLLDQENGNDA